MQSSTRAEFPVTIGGIDENPQNITTKTSINPHMIIGGCNGGLEPPLPPHAHGTCTCRAHQLPTQLPRSFSGWFIWFASWGGGGSHDNSAGRVDRCTAFSEQWPTRAETKKPEEAYLNTEI